jgi:hypothetical protein
VLEEVESAVEEEEESAAEEEEEETAEVTFLHPPRSARESSANRQEDLRFIRFSFQEFLSFSFFRRS